MRNPPTRILLLLGAIVLLTAAIYWPSLSGGFVFDDFPNIVANNSVHPKDLQFSSLKEAALASPAANLMRPLSMLSFGLDWYFSDGNPFEMKVVNLLIHLVNGVLLFLVVRRISSAAIASCEHDQLLNWRPETIAFCVSAAWLLSPINFTAVAYIVQRMESLCQVFVLLGLWGYVVARERMLQTNAGPALPTIALLLGTAFGMLAKESAALLPLYAVIVEWCLFGFRRAGRGRDQRIVLMYCIVLVVPALASIGWMLTHYLDPSAWASRAFTLAQRLLTEPRIITDYLLWTILPEPTWLSLYHDNITLSTGLFNPMTTIFSIGALVALVIIAATQRKRRPLVTIGIFWFLSAQLLTGTIIPLELVFEHRNYFASAGVYLAIFSGAFPQSYRTYVFARTLAVIAFLILLATVTWIRAMDWSNPITFATSEVEKNPTSARTAYELGRIYVVASGYRADSPFVPLAFNALNHAATMDGADALPDHALLILSENLKRPIATGVWARLQRKLSTQPLSAQNIGALYALVQCEISGICRLPSNELIACFAAALKQEPPSAAVLSIYANYAFNVLHDGSFAVELGRMAQKQSPRDLQLRENLLVLLVETGRQPEAREFYRQTLLDIPAARADQRMQLLGLRLEEAN